MLEENQVTLAIPTRDHAAYLDLLFDNLLKQTEQISIIVIDSSSDDSARRCCERFKDLRIRFYSVPVSYTAEEKCRFAIQKLETEYIWLCGDGLIPAIDVVLPLLRDKNTDMIHLVNMDARDCRLYLSKKSLPTSMTYTDAVTFCGDFFWTATFLGSLILQRSVAKMLLGDVFEAYRNTGFEIPCSALDVLSRRPCQIAVMAMHYYTPNPLKVASLWMNGPQIFEIWAERMPQAVRKLPTAFDPMKDTVIRTTAVNNNYLSCRGLIRWRSRGFFTATVEKQYEASLMQTSNVPVFYMRIIARAPVLLCKLLYTPFELRKKFRAQSLLNNRERKSV